MIGNGYWSTGIAVDYRYSGQGEYGWAAKVGYLDDGWTGDDDAASTTVATEGTLHTRYVVRSAEDGTSSLAAVIDVIKADAERLGITWKTPAIYCEPDGESTDYWPEHWARMVSEQAERIGWHSCVATA